MIIIYDSRGIINKPGLFKDREKRFQMEKGLKKPRLEIKHCQKPLKNVNNSRLVEEDGAGAIYRNT